MASPIHCRGAKSKSRSKGSTTACVRCRQKKKRCDQKLPRCRPCETAGIECYVYEPAARRQVPRSYVQSLEERVAHLESKLGDTGVSPDFQPLSAPVVSLSQQSPSYSSSSPGAHSSHDSPEASANAALDTIHGLKRQKSRPEATFSRILLADLMSSNTRHRLSEDQQERLDQSSSDIIGNLDPGPITLPNQEVAANLIKEFFQSANLGMPLLHEPTFAQKVALVYDMPLTINLTDTHTSTESRLSLYFVLEVFSIALLTMQKRDPGKIPTWLADRYHRGAVGALMEAGLPNDVEGVQTLLLIGQFYYFHPTLWTTWNTTGAALRLAVELGLHQDPPSDLDALTIDTRRRTFWVAYSMDRNISFAKNIPTCLSDGAIDVEFPSEVDDNLITPSGIGAAESKISGSKLVSIHLFQYRQIQSEIRTVLHEKLSPLHIQLDLEQWRRRMRGRINRWYEAIPSREALNIRDRIVIETFELTYHTALFYLYGPSPNSPTPSGPQWVAMTKSAMKIIQLQRKFFLEKKLTIYWQAVELVSSAGTAMMFGYVTSPQLREHIGLRSLESALHTCSSVLWGMVERFPAFQGKRDAFDVTVSSVLADLNAGPSKSGELEESPTATTPMGAAVEQWQRQQFASGAVNMDLGLETQPPSPSFMDFGDLSMIWEAAGDLSAAPTQTWI